MPEEKIEELKEEVETVKTVETETEKVETEEVSAETAQTAETEVETVQADEETSSDRTLAESIEIAEKTAASATPKKKCNKKGIIAVTVLVIVFALMLSIAFMNTTTMSDEEYYPLLEEASITIVDNSYTAIVAISTRMSYYDENEYIDLYYLDALLELQESIPETDAMLDAISKAPDTYEEHYSVLLSYYEAYLECLDLAINYGDDEAVYIETATVAFEEFVDVYTVFYDLMMADLLVE
ncbi:MAG: hypothetical protein R3Y65_01150 [Bacillota bacterium]